MTEGKKDNVIKRLEKDDNSAYHFKRFMSIVPINSDPVMMILRCHLLAEYYLDRIITTKISRGDIITDSRFQFFDKLMIVEALSVLRKDLVDSLKNLNSIRNSCSHVLEYKIVENDINKIGNPIGKTYVKLREEHKFDLKKLLHFTLLNIMAELTSFTQNIIDSKIIIQNKNPQ